MTDTLDKLFDADRRPRWKDLKEEALLEFEFTASDPESLDGVTEEPPPDSEPEIEFRYNMAGRQEMVRCVYCQRPNHYRGIVVRYPDGTRRLVGRDCALTHHGVEFEKGLVEFEAAFERQSYARRRRALLDASARVYKGFVELRADPAVTAHERALWQWRHYLDDLAAALVNIARRDEHLTVDRELRDEAGERDRKERLGARFEEERQAAKAAGQTWQLFKRVKEDVGPLQGALFFGSGVPVAKRLEEVQAEVQRAFQFLSGEELRTHQIRNGLRKLSELCDAVGHELDRLDAVAAAFDAENLARIARWANEQAMDQVRREAALDNRKAPPPWVRFVASGRSISDRQSRSDLTVSLPSVYRSPKRTLVTTLSQAISVEHEP